MEKVCERCRASKPSPGASPFDGLDYCAECSRDLCDACMEKGCCGHVPARSGMADDYPEDAAHQAEPSEAATTVQPIRDEQGLNTNGGGDGE